MRLVYLWVNNYKNIREQNFNFSSNFKYEKGLITRCSEKFENYNIFNEIDVTAIVGKNGSGKTGLLEVLMLLLFRAKELDPEKSIFKAFCIFQDKDQYFIKFSPTWTSTELLQFENKNKKFNFREFNEAKTFFLHYNYALDTISSSFKENLMNNKFDGNIYEYETTPEHINIFSQPKKSKSKIDIKKLNRETQKHMLKTTKDFGSTKLAKLLKETFEEESNINFIPSKFILVLDKSNYFESFNNSRIIQSIKSYFDNNYFKNITIDKLNKLANVFFIFRLYESFTMAKELFSSINNNYIKNQNMIDILKTIDNEDIYIGKDNLKVGDDRKIKNEYIDKSFIDNIIFEFEQKVLINNLEVKTNIIGNSIETLFPDIFDTAWYIDYIKGNSRKLTKQNVDLFTKETTINSNLIDELIKNLPSFVEIELKNKDNIMFSDLSYGEKVILRFFYNIFFFIPFFKKKNFTQFKIILDEIETGLHPEWQKKFFYFVTNITKVLSKKYTDINIHLLLATHSPFILSDIPKENIIFLDKGKNVTDSVKINTFGANIHTLLKDNFFIEGSLMGKFAQEKIQDLIYKLNDENINNKNDILKQIDIIGEPILKDKLLEMFYKVFPNDLEYLEKEKKRIENAINLIKNKV